MANENRQISIQVDDGYQQITIKNLYGDEVGVFKFNPTDIGIVQRYNDFAKNFDRIVEPLERLSEASESKDGEISEEQQKALDEATERLYEAVNKLFNGDMASAFFGKVHPFSPVDGEFYCTKALESVRKFISQQFDAQTAKITKRVEKYTKIVNKRK